jgi:hypothetical protein
LYANGVTLGVTQFGDLQCSAAASLVIIWSRKFLTITLGDTQFGDFGASP